MLRYIAQHQRWLSPKHEFPSYTPAIHLEFQVNHRRAAILPGQPMARGAATGDFLGKKWHHVMHRIGLHARRSAPIGAK